MNLESNIAYIDQNRVDSVAWCTDTLRTGINYRTLPARASFIGSATCFVEQPPSSDGVTKSGLLSLRRGLLVHYGALGPISQSEPGSLQRAYFIGFHALLYRVASPIRWWLQLGFGLTHM